MLDKYIEQMINMKYGSKFERAYDFSDTYDNFHTSLNFYRVYELDGETLVLRMSGKNILLEEKNIILEVLNETEYRPLSAEEHEIYENKQLQSKVK